jgi:hypothetical protein
MYVPGICWSLEFYTFSNTRLILPSSIAPTSKTHECITDFAAAAWVAGGEPPSMLFPLGDGPRNTEFFSSPPAKTKIKQIMSKYCSKWRQEATQVTKMNGHLSWTGQGL